MDVRGPCFVKLPNSFSLYFFYHFCKFPFIFLGIVIPNIYIYIFMMERLVNNNKRFVIYLYVYMCVYIHIGAVTLLPLPVFLPYPFFLFPSPPLPFSNSHYIGNRNGCSPTTKKAFFWGACLSLGCKGHISLPNQAKKKVALLLLKHYITQVLWCSSTQFGAMSVFQGPQN